MRVLPSPGFLVNATLGLPPNVFFILIKRFSHSLPVEPLEDSGFTISTVSVAVFFVSAFMPANESLLLRMAVRVKICFSSFLYLSNIYIICDQILHKDDG